MNYLQQMMPLFWSKPKEIANYADFMFIPEYDNTHEDPNSLKPYLTNQDIYSSYLPLLYANTFHSEQDPNQTLTNTSDKSKFLFTWDMDQPSTTAGPRGIRNNNWGNIIKTNKHWLGEVGGSNSRFEQFETPEFGVSAMAQNLRSYVTEHNKRTIADIIGRWAPSNENNTSSYIQNVSKMVGVDPYKDIADKVLSDDEFLIKLMKAIAIIENGHKQLQTIGNVDQILRSGLAIANKNRIQK